MAGLEIMPYHDLGAVKITCTDIASGNPVTLQRDKCKLVTDKTEDFIFWDFHAPIGAPLKYKLQLSNNDEMEADTTLLSEGGFLSDKTRCIPVLYDLDITSYKYNIIDTVTPTLGGKYPFIRRNGHQKYRSFNLSGLISYHAEEVMQAEAEAPNDHYYEDIFLKQFEADYSGLRASVTETDYERIKERQYRESVINFLQDGQVKLFRTLEECNIFVRLTNVTLTPKKELGRMIYTFSCVAVECMDTSDDNYERYCYGTYEASGGGSSDVTLIEKTITENGEYPAVNDGADGYFKVTVNVASEQVEEYDGTVVIRATIKGKWVFNDTVDLWSNSGMSADISFISNNQSFKVMYHGMSTNGFVYAVLKYDDLDVCTGDIGAVYHWENNAYKTVDFGTTEQVVSDNFYSWLTANATYIGESEEETPKTTITYNGLTIASLEAGQIATVSCEGEKMKSDIVVEAPESESAKLYGIEVTPTKDIQNIVPEGDYDGFDEVIVNPIPDEYVIPNLQEKTATENGDVTADEGYTGLSKVTVNVPSEEPNLISKTITENGTYKASEEVDDNIIGKWNFNDTLTAFPQNSSGNYSYDINFYFKTTILQSCVKLEYSASVDVLYGYTSSSNDNPIYRYSDSSWGSNSHYIDITSVSNLSANDKITLFDWLKVNATKETSINIVDGYSEVIVNVERLDTSDATATADKILKDETAYVNGEKVTGSIETYDGVSTREDDSIIGTWVFGSTLSSGYTESFLYNINANYTIYSDVIENGTLSQLGLYSSTGGDYYFPALPSYTSQTKHLLYYGYRTAPTVRASSYPNFSSFHLTITGGDDVTNTDLLSWLKANAKKQSISMTSPDGIILETEGKYVDRHVKIVPTLEVKSVIPTTEEQVIVASDGYIGLSSVTVAAIPETEDSPLPIEVSTEAEMTALLESGEVGGVYKYTGETTDTYENGALYLLEEEVGE